MENKPWWPGGLHSFYKLQLLLLLPRMLKGEAPPGLPGLPHGSLWPYWRFFQVTYSRFMDPCIGLLGSYWHVWANCQNQPCHRKSRSGGQGYRGRPWKRLGAPLQVVATVEVGGTPCWWVCGICGQEAWVWGLPLKFGSLMTLDKLFKFLRSLFPHA